MANSENLKRKKDEVKELSKKIKDAKVVLLTDYKGITVEDVTNLRYELRNVNAEYMVIKNNIIKRALDSLKIKDLEELLVGPTALIISDEDYLSSTKTIYNYTKTNQSYIIKGGMIEGEVKSSEEIIVLAKLPSREELIAKLASGLLGTISKLAVALDQVRIQKEIK